MATTNLFGDPVFRDGAFTSNDARVRALRAAEDDARPWTSASSSAPRRTCSGADAKASRPNAAQGSAGSDQVVPRRASTSSASTSIAQGYDFKFALEPKPNEPRGDIFLPTIGHMLAFIYTLDHPDMVGLNPEVAHDTMAGLDFSHGVAQALEAGKLFHIDLNGQKPGRFDQDLRFGSEDLKAAFFLVKLLEDSKWDGMRHFDSHAYRTEDEAGRLGLRRAAACARISSSRRRSRASTPTPEIQGLLGELRARGAATGARVKFTADGARELKDAAVRPRRRCARRATRTSGSTS